MRARSALAAMALLCSGLPLGAQTMAADPPLLRASESLPPSGRKTLRVSTPGWRNGGDIPFDYTQYRANIFPGLTWSKGPRGTRSYAIIMQDIDVVRDGVGRHALHWTMVNIPATVTRLPVGMAPDAKPAGSSYGPNYKGQAQPYLGPRTRPGPKHRYYFQIFALDTLISLPAEASYEDLTAQMKGHVLASGEMFGLGRADPAAQ